jgi:hypothetical protein
MFLSADFIISPAELCCLFSTGGGSVAKEMRQYNSEDEADGNYEKLGQNT